MQLQGLFDANGCFSETNFWNALSLRLTAICFGLQNTFSRSTNKIWFKGGDAGFVTAFKAHKLSTVQIFDVNLPKKFGKPK